MLKEEISIIGPATDHQGYRSPIKDKKAMSQVKPEMPRNLDLKPRASATKRSVAAAVAVPTKTETTSRQSRERTAEKKSSRVNSATKTKSKRSSKGSEESKKMQH